MGVSEFSWLIERIDLLAYWDGRGTRAEHGPRTTYTHDPNDAVRFARKEDAERVIAWLLPDEPVKAVEHGWVANCDAVHPRGNEVRLTPPQRIRLTDAQQSALECAGLGGDDVDEHDS